MQKRYWIATKTDIHEAYQLKKQLLEESPDRDIQIRKGRDGGNIVFRVVERFTTNETKVIQESKSKSKRKRGRKTVDVSWATS